MTVDVGDIELQEHVESRVRALSDVVCPHISELYKVGAKLGEGRFSTVHVGEATGTGQKYALKVVENAGLNEEENLEALEQEVKILRMLDHPYVVKLKEVVMTDENTYICMELLNGGELFEKIIEFGSYPEAEAATVFARLLVSVEFMHSRNIVHRDLKPENILFVSPTSAGTGDVPTDIKVIDFGYAGIWTPSKELTGLCGTPDYVAPEILTWYDEENGECLKYGKPSDVWSLGVLLYVLLSGCSPFAADDEDVLLKLVASARYTFPDKEWSTVSDQAKDVVRRALVVDPTQRITLSELMQHPWCRDAVAEVQASLKSAGKSPGPKPRKAKSSKSSASCCVVS
mmetsp:Transcript_5218/g.14310  ORF Transcript_5218/g.14310 Transcript_5218/m.14310 type:complete len:344 (+) Transcript_5218:127-1158(+)